MIKAAVIVTKAAARSYKLEESDDNGEELAENPTENDSNAKCIGLNNCIQIIHVL